MGELSFKIEFFGGGVVECVGNDGYDVVGDVEWFVKFFWVGNYLVKYFLWFFGICEVELFYFGKFVDVENVLDIFVVLEGCE